MLNKLYISLALGAVALSGCQRQQIGGFQASQHESFARTTPAPVATAPVESALSLGLTSEVAVLSPAATPALPLEATPALTASTTKKLVATAKGTKYESRVAQLKTALEEAAMAPKTGVTARKLTFMEKTISKMVLKKVNKQIAKEKKGESTQALSRDIKIGLILVVAGLILFLIPGLSIPAIIALVVGGVFLVIGLINRA